MARTSTEQPRAMVACLALAAMTTLGVAVAASAHAPDAGSAPATSAAPSVVPELAAVTKRYREALERKELAALRSLHDEQAVIFESGHMEGSFADYEKGHLGPELEAFKTFRFTRWDETSRVLGDTGLVFADIGYAIELKDGRKIDSQGVATLVLERKKDGGWRVIHSHWSTQRKK